MIRRPPRSTRTDTLVPYTSLCRSAHLFRGKVADAAGLNPRPSQVRIAALRIEHEAILVRSEEHTSELQLLMRISYAVFSLKQKRAFDTSHAVPGHHYAHLQNPLIPAKPTTKTHHYHRHYTAH